MLTILNEFSFDTAPKRSTVIRAGERCEYRGYELSSIYSSGIMLRVYFPDRELSLEIDYAHALPMTPNLKALVEEYKSSLDKDSLQDKIKAEIRLKVLNKKFGL